MMIVLVKQQFLFQVHSNSDHCHDQIEESLVVFCWPRRSYCLLLYSKGRSHPFLEYTIVPLQLCTLQGVMLRATKVADGVVVAD